MSTGQENSGVIHVQHPTMRGRSRPPYGFGTHDVTPEQLTTLESIAVSTFAAMVSNGQTFQAALAAVYYSGIVHALESQS